MNFSVGFWSNFYQIVYDKYHVAHWNVNSFKT